MARRGLLIGKDKIKIIPRKDRTLRRTTEDATETTYEYVQMDTEHKRANAWLQQINTSLQLN